MNLRFHISHIFKGGNIYVDLLAFLAMNSPLPFSWVEPLFTERFGKQTKISINI